MKEKLVMISIYCNSERYKDLNDGFISIIMMIFTRFVMTFVK